MNNTEMNFDPMTGEPLNNTNNINTTPVSQQNIPIIQPQQVQPTQSIEHPQIIEQPIKNNNITQQPIQTIPTIEQSKEQFIDNTQNISETRKEEKKEGINYVFIVILFIIIFAAIFFLFPYLLEVL